MKINDPRLLAPQCDSLLPVEIIHENQWFHLVNRGGYFTIEYKKPQVVILPIMDKLSIVMVRVKRPILDDITLELPAGGTEKDETPISASARELEEETGILIRDLNRFKLIPSIAISPNRYPILPHIYQIHIEKHEFTNRKHHDSEISSVECISFQDVQRMMAQGEIYVSLPMAIIGRFFFQNMTNLGIQHEKS